LSLYRNVKIKMVSPVAAHAPNIVSKPIWPCPVKLHHSLLPSPTILLSLLPLPFTEARVIVYSPLAQRGLR
jgi:hypothetical protein